VNDLAPPALARRNWIDLRSPRWTESLRQRDAARVHLRDGFSGLPSAPSNIAIIGTRLWHGHVHLEASRGRRSRAFVSYVVRRNAGRLICAQATGALTAGRNNTTRWIDPFGGPLVRSTWALPSPYVSKIR